MGVVEDVEDLVLGQVLLGDVVLLHFALLDGVLDGANRGHVVDVGACSLRASSLFKPHRLEIWLGKSGGGLRGLGQGRLQSGLVTRREAQIAIVAIGTVRTGTASLRTIVAAEPGLDI
jgi:hypothetical protein